MDFAGPKAIYHTNKPIVYMFKVRMSHLSDTASQQCQSKDQFSYKTGKRKTK